MPDYEYALRTVTVASGQEFEIAHAVTAGTLVALCGTVAVPQPGSRWANTDPDARCETCERLVQEEQAAQPPIEEVHWPVRALPAEPDPEPSAEEASEEDPPGEPDLEGSPGAQQPAAEVDPEPAPGSEPASEGATDEAGADHGAQSPTAAGRAGAAVDRLRGSLSAVSRRVWIIVAVIAVLLIAALVAALSLSSGFHADQNSPAYRNGYAYGHDLMDDSVDVTGFCTRASVDDPASLDGKNFIAGCEAGYGARAA